MNVVLVDPEIPFNAGNVGRTCAATGSTLHFVGRLGFKIESKEIRRSGLDYWEKLRWRRHADWEAFLKTVPPGASLLFFSAGARRSFWDAPFARGCYLVFGCESSGLPPAVLERFRDRCYRIPMRRSMRSLNLSTAAGVALYEALRRTRKGAPRRDLIR